MARHEPEVCAPQLGEEHFDLAAERELMGRIIAHPAVLIAASYIGLRGYHFHVPAHAMVWGTITAIILETSSQTVLDLLDTARNEASFVTVGGIPYFQGLAAKADNAAPLEELVDRIWTAAMRRDAWAKAAA